jgi:hypothetical protein
MTSARARSAPHVRSGLVATLVVLIGSLVLGGLTSYGQTYLPEQLRSFSNSSGGWTILAFALVWVSRARIVLAAVLGVVSFEMLVEGYRIVSDWRGFYFAAPFSSVWSLVGLAAGPVLGIAASLTRYGSALWRALALTVPAAVLAGEGAWALRNVSATTSPVYWIGQIALAAVLVGLGVAGLSTTPSRRLAIVSLWVFGGAAFYAVLTALSGTVP